MPPVQWAHQPGQRQQLGLSSHNSPVAIQPHTINTPQPHKVSAPTPSIPPLPNRLHPAQPQVAGLPHQPRLPASIPPVRMPQASHTVQRMEKNTKEEKRDKPKKLGRANKRNVEKNSTGRFHGVINTEEGSERIHQYKASKGLGGKSLERGELQEVFEGEAEEKCQ